ncbi:hypothetical protein [Rhodovulum imhoffii]|nr:hypothetical protein [Rhodovulum imhoffii]MBK5932671.1 hypothetical protein [Rhodovulum imhoffii]
MQNALKAVVLVALLAATPANARDAERLVTVVTSPEPQVQAMSMVLTLQAVQRGVATRILLCGPAADIALREAPGTATAGQPPQGASPQGLLKSALDGGVRVEVCALYLPGKGLSPEALIDGVNPAAPPAMARTLLDSKARVWSF